MADRVEIAFRRTALPLIPRGTSVLAAVSGGGDSVALLHLLARMSSRGRLRLAVAHLDHGLRRGSATDRRFVERLAGRLGLRCVSDRRPVGRLRREGESPEEAARRVRREFLIDAAAEVGAAWIATGHTLDDQAETILMRFVRGAGPRSLAGMSAVGPGPFVRPLLGIEREELRGFLKRHRLAFREDPSNRNLRFDRNRVRRLVLPLLAETMNPRAARHIVEAAGRLREDAEYLDSLARATLETTARESAREGRLSMPAAALSRCAPPLARRIARLALERAGCDPRRIGTRHVEGLLRLAREGGGGSLDLPSRIGAARRGRIIQFDRRG